jgi:hypothetical protein
MEEHNKFHLPKQFNEDRYNHVIHAFQGQKNINVVIHVKDFNAQGDGVYTQQNEKQQEEHFPMQSFWSFMQEFLEEDNVPKDSQDVQQVNICINQGLN